MNTLAGLFVFLAALALVGAVGVAIAKRPGREALALAVCGGLLLVFAVGARAAGYSDRRADCEKRERAAYDRYLDTDWTSEAQDEKYGDAEDSEQWSVQECSRQVQRLGGSL